VKDGIGRQQWIDGIICEKQIPSPLLLWLSHEEEKE